MTKTIIHERLETLYAMIAFAEEHGNWRQVEKLEEMVARLVDELTELKKKG